MPIYDAEYFKKEFAELNVHKREMERIDARGKRWFFGDDCQEQIAVGDLVRQEHPHLTANQHAALVAKLEAEVDEPTMHKKGWLRRTLDKALEKEPSMVAKIPSPHDLMFVLGYDKLEPTARLTKFRELSALSDDERGALMPKDAAASDAPAEKKEEAPPAPKNFRTMSDDELDQEMATRHGMNLAQYRHNNLPSVIMQNRAALRSSAPAVAPSGAKVDPSSESFKALHPRERLRLWREQEGGAK